MRVTLQLLRAAKPILSRKVLEQRFRIGSHEDNEFCLASADVPPFLCEIEHKGPKYVLKNVCSRGVLVNGEVIKDSIRLAHNDVLKLGAFDLQVLVLKEEVKPGHVKTKSLFEFDDAQSACLNVRVVGRPSAEFWSIDAQGLTFGSSDTCDIVLDDAYVSGLHGRFYRQENKFFIEDLESRNGLRVDGNTIVHAEVKSGVRVVLGNTQLEVAARKTSLLEMEAGGNELVPLIGTTQWQP